ncbi:MAG: dihydropteroate synthase [Candidatus Omnitrophica bacterium CG11_big_fil_rev_8_21_14_0_20_63_9]|nr:MAG: dihydropteroate synthase [Candidatus Omnitrophica bacterium CG11_big_fil_rev_8_21_14_0_20_63_9]
MAALTLRTPPRQLAPHRTGARTLTIPTAKRPLVYRGTSLVMGILNVTPDSFSDGGRYLDVSAAVARGVAMAQQGADVLDIGGESTRPGAAAVSAAEELDRVVPVIEQLTKAVRIPLSVDTAKAAVADAALRAGASLINDVTALQGDPQMARVACQSHAAVILMHMRGTPRTMQRHPRYRDVIGEVLAFLREAAGRAQQAGIDRRRIIIDPGLGFGKTVAHNLQLMAALDRFVGAKYPVLIGPSRKSFIGKTLRTEVGERLAGTLACVGAAHLAGAHMVRVHDVQETVHYLKMADAIRRQY